MNASEWAWMRWSVHTNTGLVWRSVLETRKFASIWHSSWQRAATSAPGIAVFEVWIMYRPSRRASWSARADE
ncbi:MAG: hypothetical protein LBD97_05545 [Bifidobacteriaceae bacterium]|nr:hypothetical protein [Bifidobacteriaceae bacterium]